MKKLLLGLLILGSFSSFAQYHNGHDLEVPGIINETLSNIDSFLKVREDEVNLNYPEYSAAFNNFKDQVARSNRENSIILSKVNQEISRFRSELAELKRQYKKNPSDALNKLIQKKETTEMASLQMRVNNEYQTFLKNVMALDSKLKVATKIKFKGFGIEQLVLTFFPLFTPFTITGIIPGFYLYKVVDNFGQTISAHDADYGVFEATRKLPEAKAALAQYLSEVARRLFSDCRTQGCVYFLAEDYINYINLVSKLNVTVKNDIGLKFKKVKFLKKQTIQAIDKTAEMAAEGLPTGAF